MLLLPTAPTVYTVAQVLADPIELNCRLGTYTNFVNLLDLCGLALPAAMRSDGIPFGVTLLAPGGQRRAARLARPHLSCRHRTAARRARAWRSRRSRRFGRATQSGEIALAVVGAHLSGMALNRELDALGARLPRSDEDRARLSPVRARRRTPPKPGLLRVEAGQRHFDRGRGLGARRRQPSAASSRRSRRRSSIGTREPRRRPQRQRLPGRIGGNRPARATFRVRRLAGVHGGGGSGLKCAWHRAQLTERCADQFGISQAAGYADLRQAASLLRS